MDYRKVTKKITDNLRTYNGPKTYNDIFDRASLVSGINRPKLMENDAKWMGYRLMENRNRIIKEKQFRDIISKVDSTIRDTDRGGRFRR